MQKLSSIALFSLILLSTPLISNEKKRQTLYHSLSQTSAIEQLSFYQLYPDSKEGKKALEKAKYLLSGNSNLNVLDIPLDSKTIEAILFLLNTRPVEEERKLSKTELASIDHFAKRLPNRHLKGFYCNNEKEVLALPDEEIDLARALLLSQNYKSPCLDDILHYEAAIDLMALHILTKLPLEASPKEKIQAINAFIFQEMRFRFPPRSKYAKAIDIYTNLSSVLDSRQGVCLGVSILYLSLAQRLEISLEIITPPGHIYIRYKNGSEEINIETTARGIDIPTEEYLSIETAELQKRTIKEVVGLQHVNNASPFLQSGDFKKALESYERALLYLPDDAQILELKGYCHLLLGESNPATTLFSKLSKSTDKKPGDEASPFEDYLAGHADQEAIQALFFEMDDTRSSLLKKKEIFEKITVRCPKFREGWKALAMIWLNLYRPKEAIKALNQYHLLDPNNLTVEFYLAELYKTRLDYAKSWQHLLIAEEISKSRHYLPEELKDLRRELTLLGPIF